MMRHLTRLRTFVGLLVAAILAWTILPQGVQAGPMERFAQGRIESALSAPGRIVKVEGLSGNPFSNASIDKITVSDDTGIWLEITGITGSWRLTTLIRGRLEITSVSIDSVDVIRRPESTETEQSGDGGGSPPVAIDLQDMRIADLTLNEAVIGIAAQLGVSGSGLISGDQLKANVDVVRKDATGGELKADFDYAPNEDVLSADVHLEEPANGLVSNLLRLEGRPSVSLDVNGSGSLSDWQGDLTFVADQSERFSGQARISSNNGDSRLQASGSGDLADLVPEPYSAALSGQLALEFDGTRASSGAVEITKATASTETINLQAAGRLSKEMRPISGAAIAKIQDPSGSTVALPFVPGSLSLNSLDLSARLQAGNDAPWTADLTISGLRQEQLNVDSLVVRGTGSVSDLSNIRRRAIAADLQASANGLAFDNMGLQDAIGQSLSLTGSASLAGSDPWQIDNLRLASETFQAAYSGTLDPEGLKGQVSAELGDLSDFAELTRRPLSGSASLAADGSATLTGLFSADLNAEFNSLDIATPVAQKILSGTVTLKGQASRNEDGLAFSDLILTSPDFSTTLNGELKEVFDLSIEGTLSDLAQINDKTTGAIEFEGTVKGDASAPNVDFDVTGDDVTLMDRPLRNARLTVKAITGGSDFGGSASLSGRLGDVRLDGSADLSGSQQNPEISNLSIMLGDTALSGNLRLDAGLATGDLSFVSLDLSEIGPLVLQDLSGSASGKVRLNVENGQQMAEVSAKADSVNSSGFSIGLADLSANVANAFGDPLISGTMMAENIVSGGITVTKLSGDASVQGGATDFSMTGVAMDASFGAAGEVGFSDNSTIVTIDSANVARDGLSARLAEPAKISLANGGFSFDPIKIAAAGGTITVRSNSSDQKSFAVALKDLQASTARTFVPDLDPSGSLNGTIAVDLANESSPVTFDISMTNVSAAPIANAGLPALSASAKGALENQAVSLQAKVGAQNIDLDIDGTVPLSSTETINLKITGGLPLSLAEAPIAERGSTLGGILTVDLSVGGPVRAPEFGGTIATSGASFTDPLTGVAIRDLTLNAVFANDRLTIQTLTARANDSGTIDASGTIGLDPAAGLPADVTATIRSAQYNDGNIVSTTFDADLKLTGALLQDALLGGSVTLKETEIRIPESLGGPGQAIDVQHVDAPASVEQTLRTIADHNPDRKDSGGAQGGIRLNVELSAPDQIFVRGRGLDAELGGSLTLSGYVTSPVAVGGFSMRRGRIDILARRIEFTRGNITFEGSLEPRLDLEASTTSEGTVVTITVEGPASNPEITFSSSPPLPQDEVLAQLLFGQNINDLTTGQAAQLGVAAAELGGIPITSGVLGELRQALGVDDLDVTTDDEGNAAVRLGTHIGDNAYISVEQGSGASSTRLTIDLDITKNFKARGEVGTTESKAGIFFQRDY